MSAIDRSGAYSVDPSGSLSTVLQLGLIKVKPIEERSIIKTRGLKFIETRRRLEPEKGLETDFKSVFMEMVLSEADLPARFKASDVKERWSKHLSSILDKDPPFKEAVEKLDKAKEMDYVGAFRNIVSMLKQRVEKVKQHLDEEEAIDFLESDLPLSYYVNDAEYAEAFGIYLSLLEEELGRANRHLKSSRARTQFVVFERHFKELKAKLSRYVDIADTVFFTDRVLSMFLDAWNSETLDEMFEHKKLSIKKVDLIRYEELMEKNRQAITDFKVFLLKTGVSNQFDRKLDFSEPMPAALRDMSLEFTEG